jgi:hypothetical protein
MTDRETVRAALDTMLVEAGRWREASGRMRDACESVQRLTLDTTDFSGAANDAGLVDAYKELQLKLLDLIDQGGQQFMDTALRLETVVKQSQRTEQENAERLARVKQSLEELGL